jgi:hypothetical protein
MRRITAQISSWRRHLSEERLFDYYTAERHGEVTDLRAGEHLAECGDCAARYGALAAFMDDLRETADEETSAIFTPEMLAAQQQQIAGRLELLGHAARVLSFPAHIEMPKAAGMPRTRVASGWVAAAAAAGLFVGVSAGMMFDAKVRGQAVPPPAVTQPASVPAPAPAPARADVPSTAPPWLSDVQAAELEAELDAVLDRPRTPELFALDLMTPHVRDIKYRR